MAKYTKPEINIVEISVNDIIQTSGLIEDGEMD